MNQILTKLKENADLVESEINRILSVRDESYGVLYSSMLYSAQGGGKRIRPFLTLEVCKALGGSIDSALPLAVAVEHRLRSPSRGSGRAYTHVFPYTRRPSLHG